MWRKATDHRNPNASIHVISFGKEEIKLGLWHFCKETVSASTPKRLHLLVYQNPASLKQVMDAYITVYAIPKWEMKVHLISKFLCKDN